MTGKMNAGDSPVPEDILREIVYLGIKGRVLALNRANGEILWSTHLAGGDFVTVMLDRDVVLAATKGEIFCVDAKSGDIRWRNLLPGMGLGLITIATANGNTGISASAAKRSQDEAAEEATIAATG
jgi:outer membrane protein assembly factor BamB